MNGAECSDGMETIRIPDCTPIAFRIMIQYLYSNNNSNIDIYDYNRSEVSSAVRCDLN